MLKNTYKKKSLIYNGNISQVSKYYNKNTNELNVIKKFNTNFKINYENEINAINSFPNNILNINRYLDHFIIDNNYYIVYPYYETDLYDFTESYKINVTEFKHILLEIIEPLKYIHDILQGYHGDIKSENILITKDLKNIKLIDFDTFGKNHKLINRQFGTIVFMAPEVILLEDITSKCDIWGFGCLMYELLTSKLLFNYNTIKNSSPATIRQLKVITNLCGNFEESYLLSNQIYKKFNDEFNDECKNINIHDFIYNKLKKSIITNVEDSINITNLFVSIFKLNPDDRPSINEVEKIILSIKDKR